MPRYVTTQKTFHDGDLLQVGDEIESSNDPGYPFVPSATYKPAETDVVPVPRDSGFCLSTEAGQTWGLPNGATPRDKPQGSATATRLKGRSSGEGRY